jgi:hypothetical protein
MSLLGGDLTTQQRVSTWLANAPAQPSPILAQLIGSMSTLIYNKLNRGRLYSRTHTRIFDGVGNSQLVLPDWPVTSIASVQQGCALIPPSVLVPQGTVQPPGTSPGYGYRYVPWGGNLPGDPSVLEFVNGCFYPAYQNVQVTYTAGYLVANEAQSVPAVAPYVVTVTQPQGIWCRDNGIVYASGGALTPVTGTPTVGQYVVGPDSSPGQYTFSAADAGKALLISYSFIPADLEEATIQMVAERYSYRSRVGEESKSLGGQETVRFMRGNSGRPWNRNSSLPPEVMDLINPYVSVLAPAIGAPL